MVTKYIGTLTVLAVVASLTACRPAVGETPRANIRQADFRDKVYACWLGKALGGTLGQPLEGKHGPHDVPLATKLSQGIANDEADLEILWLAALEEHDAQVDARRLGEYWLRYVKVDWNEYGVGKKNMRLGLLPPLSGEFQNEPWKHSNGAWARAEVWGCLAPGCPALAARLAWEDACVDHGVAREGTLAAMYIAALESAAFVENDRQRLISTALSVIPAESETSRAIRTALAAWKAGQDWQTARQAVIDGTKTGWFMASRDVAFIVIGWLYGQGDYRRTLITTLNCGDDTDSTVATVASILGIVGGTQTIDPEWKQAVGDQVKTCILTDEFRRSPQTVDELTDRTVAMARRILARHSVPVVIGDAATDVRLPTELPAADLKAIRTLLELPLYTAIWNDADLQIRLDYQADPSIAAGVPRKLLVTMENRGAQAVSVASAIDAEPAGWEVHCLPSTAKTIEPQSSERFELSVTAPAVEQYVNRLHLKITGLAREVTVPWVLLGQGFEPQPAAAKTAKPSPTKDNLALASLGAVATSDSELDWEQGCTSQAIDGIIGGEDNRWHSSLAAPHPHWLQVKLPRAATIGRVMIHFADPCGYPVDFRGSVIAQGAEEFQEIFRVTGNSDPYVWRGAIAPVVTDTLRLIIDKSVNPVSLNAAQISEIELCPPATGEPTAR
jgi:ADP-ribosylglycohydrolase